MASCGLEAVNELLQEAASQLGLDSLRDHKEAPYCFNFSRVTCIYHKVFALQPTVSGKLMKYQLLLPVNQRYYLKYNEYSKVLLYLYINMSHTKDWIDFLEGGKQTIHRWL